MTNIINPGTLVVTGGSRGIGAAVAKLAAEHGYAVALNFASGKVEARKMVDEIGAAGGAGLSENCIRSKV